MNVFVVGATGAIGRFAVPALLRAGHQVTGVARNDAKAKQLVDVGAQSVAVSIFDHDALVEVLRGHEVVVNLATRIPPIKQMRDPAAWADNDRIRREASGIISDAAAEAGAAQLVQESITFPYPDRGDQWIDEEVPTDTPAALSATAVAEAAAHRFTERGGVGVVLRFAALYGPGSELTVTTARLARRHVAMTVGDPRGFVSAVHTADAGAAVAAALDAPAGTYNVVEDAPVTRRELGRIVGDAVGARPWLYLPGRFTKLAGQSGSAMARSQRVSNRKLRDTTGWAPAFPSAREGWADIVANGHDRG